MKITDMSCSQAEVLDRNQIYELPHHKHHSHFTGERRTVNV